MHGLDPAWLLGNILDFGTEAGDVFIDRPRRWKRGITPDDVEKRSRDTTSPG